MKALLSLIIPLSFAFMWLVEARWPARQYVSVKAWHLIGAVFFIGVMLVASATPFVWAKVGLSSLQVFDLSGLGWWGYPVGLLLTTGIAYWWHRAEHRFDLLWRVTHQLHHSALRVDIPGAFYTHPLEVVVKSTLGILVGTVLLGLMPLAAATVSLTVAFISLFQHWNIATPRWLGWFVPRPEMHGLHHEYNVHARNYAELPLWDMLFGTYSNPDSFTGRVGFDVEPSGRIIDMLLMRDVNRTPAQSDSVPDHLREPSPPA
ncbi:MAG TPA: fatty acid hydroxylase family protein [Pseudomonas xinjiangensis]|uniref:Fatty acid hydroxylase family protein n=2 Tax=root TaxID=1 RepID=A0A7V1BQA6_9GAMM|nr:fatty acid hydroxylase family protein [Halopseudomonas xinjiangensis]HEC48484.1 fatty acid hydroxylase family protein [Halopseudomonas xinjiangensis]